MCESNMAAETGRTLVLSCSENLSALEAVKQIHGGAQLPKPESVSPVLEGITWTIHTKYFDVETDLCFCKPDASITPDTAKTSYGFNDFEAMVILFDQSKASSFKEVKCWHDYIASLKESPSVLLLLNTEHKDSTIQGVSSKDVLEWCLANSFELVELYPDSDEQEEAGEFGEQTGFGRVRQALQCAEWPNIRLTDGPSAGNAESVEEKKTLDKTVQASQSDAAKAPANSHASVNRNKSTLGSSALFADDEKELLSRLGNEDPGGESFEQLFQRLNEMKERAASLPDDERKSYAEKVAVAFWRAMGGDEEEVSGLSDDD